MKKAFICFLLLLACVPVFSSCDNANEAITINVFNWGEYIADGSFDSMDINEAFTDYCEETYGVRVNVNYSTYASNEDLYAKLKSGGVSYDIVIPSDYMIQRMIKEDMLAEIDYDNIPNRDNLREEYLGMFFDPEDKYSVPYCISLIGIIYNTELCDEPIDSWKYFFDDEYAGKYKGKFYTFNNSRDAFGIAQIYAGIDVNTTDKEDWQKVYDMVVSQKQYLKGYVMDEIYNKMESGEAAYSVYYAGDFFTMYDENDSLAFAFPKEGTNTFVDSVCIPKNAKHKQAAEWYINFLLEPDTALENAYWISYGSPCKSVIEDEEYIAYYNEEYFDGAFGIINDPVAYTGDPDYIEKTYYYHDLPTETLQLINDLWNNLKTEGFEGAGVYIFAGAILLLFIVFIIIKTVNKYKKGKNW